MDEAKGNERPSKIMELLYRQYPGTNLALSHANPLELLVATMLSAQCTDRQVNIVTKDLFRKYKKAEEYANADLKELEQDIKSTGFYRNKAKNLKGCARLLVEKFHSKVPKTMEELTQCPGVARKTANIVLTNAYGVVSGIAVDTHVKRISFRLGFTKNTNPDKIEQDLMGMVPKDKWPRFNGVLVTHGRRVCTARKPNCGGCVVNKLCPSAFKFQ